MKKIAVFTSHVYEPMCSKTQKGINDAALDCGIKVIYFASFSDSYSGRNYDEYTKYDQGDNVSFDIPDIDDFDGVIKISTYFSPSVKNHLEQILLKTNKPVINIGAAYDPKFMNIVCDDTHSFSEIVDHVIEVHGCKDIYHLAGIPEKPFSQERLEAYKSSLIAHGIEYDENKVFYGNLWRDCGEDALNYILGNCKKEGKEYPDAVVCANDYSAIGLLVACRERGIRVPEDMIVTGFDGVDDAVNGYPTLTTSRQPFYNSGYSAVLALNEIFEGKEIPKTIRIMAEFMANQSCGCKPKTADDIQDFRNIYLKRIRNTTDISQSTTNLMLSVANAETLPEFFDAVKRNAKWNSGFKDMLLCLAPGWDQQRIVGDDFAKTDEDMTIVTGYRGDEDVEVRTFRKKDILPKDMLEDPNPYYIFTIHHLQYYMGYLIVSPNIDMHEQEAQQSWLVDLGMIFENRRIQRDLQSTVKRLEFLYSRDMLTGLYNRHGVEKFFTKYLDECCKNGTGLAVMVFDMDDLKLINDNYGHYEGDYSIKAIASALQAASEDDEMCTRSGGDEFVVLAKNYDHDRARVFINNVRDYISAKIRSENKHYDVVVSAGVYIADPSKLTKDDRFDDYQLFSQYLKLADSAMYDEKRRHKKDKGA
ncbi:MAG: GGDEF domain-containing protein [Clostridiales bacterium]|nr:GGDEF domain-containing protein [Clostridiales bacterium]